LLVQDIPAVHTPQLPLPSHTMLVPQLVPPILLLPSAQVIEPVVQEETPFLQMLGLPVHAPPAVQGTHAPEPLQTMFVPQLTPGLLLVPSTQTGAPLVQAIIPFLQALLGLVVQDMPAVQATQVPEPLQTMFVPQLAPADLLPPSMQVMAPVVHMVVPFRQGLGLPVQDMPAVQPMQLPEPLQTMLVPQLLPGDLLVPSMQVGAPVEHDVVPFLQRFELPVHELPMVQATQPPPPLQTMLVPQLVPAVFGVPFTHIDMPVAHDAVPA